MSERKQVLRSLLLGALTSGVIITWSNESTYTLLSLGSVSPDRYVTYRISNWTKPDIGNVSDPQRRDIFHMQGQLYKNGQEYSSCSWGPVIRGTIYDSPEYIFDRIFTHIKEVVPEWIKFL